VYGSDLTGAAFLLRLAAIVIGAVGSVCAAIYALRWFYRAHRNLRARGQAAAHPAWAVGCWFIPLANIVVPVRLTDSLWRASRQGQAHEGALAGWSILWLVLATWSHAGLAWDLAARDSATLAGSPVGDVLLMQGLSGWVRALADLCMGLLFLQVVFQVSRWQDAVLAQAPPASPPTGAATDGASHLPSI